MTAKSGLLVLALLALTLFERDHLAFASQLAAVVLAPVAGLMWRGGRGHRSILELALAGLLGLVGLAALPAGARWLARRAEVRGSDLQLEVRG